MILENDNNLSFKLDFNLQTATIISSPRAKGKVIVPKYIEHESNQFQITTIDCFAFHRNLNIESLQFAPNSSMKRICEKAFIDSSLNSLHIPESLADLDLQWCFGASHLFNIDVDPRNKNFVYIDDKFLIKIDQSRNYEDLIFTRRDVKGKIIIPGGVKRLSETSFSNCRKLESILSFSENSSLKIIDNYAFNGCENVTKMAPIPGSVRIIGNESFESMYKLVSLEFLSEKIDFGGMCFWECRSLLCMAFPNAKIVGINKNSLHGIRNDFVLLIRNGALIKK